MNARRQLRHLPLCLRDRVIHLCAGQCLLWACTQHLADGIDVSLEANKTISQPFSESESYVNLIRASI